MEQLVGKSFGEMLPGEEACVAMLERVLRSGNSECHTQPGHFDPQATLWCFTMWPVTSNERPVGVMIQVAASTRPDGTTLRAMNEALMVGSVRQQELTEAAEAANAQLQQEMSERQHAEEMLRRAQAALLDRAGQLEELVLKRTAELTATNDQLETIVYSIAHHLRAPLRSMQGFATMLVKDAGANLSESAADYARRINQSAQYLDAMLNDLLVFSRISQQPMELTPVDLKPVVETVLSQLKDIHQESIARVENAGPWPVALAHKPTLAQVLFNLTSNALKFVTTDGPPVVRLWAQEQPEFVRIWVEDNGRGIAPGHQEEIFQLFTRLDGEMYPGTGLGLAIVKKGVERMGGRVGMESASGHGSRFWFELKKV